MPSVPRLWDVVSMMNPEDVKGTHLDDPKVQAAWAGMVMDSTPAFYLEHLKRLKAHGIQPYFVPAHVHQWEIIERLIRAGVYMGPVNMCFAAYGGGTLGRNPMTFIHFLERLPQNAVATIWSSMRGNHTLQAMGIILGIHVRVGNEDNLWGANRERSTTLQQIKGAVDVCKRFGRRVATAEEARKIMKIGVTYNSAEETLQALGMPPNPVDYHVGLQLWETDGKKDRGSWGAIRIPLPTAWFHQTSPHPRKRKWPNSTSQRPASRGAGRCVGIL